MITKKKKVLSLYKTEQVESLKNYVHKSHGTAFLGSFVVVVFSLSHWMNMAFKHCNSKEHKSTYDTYNLNWNSVKLKVLKYALHHILQSQKP